MMEATVLVLISVTKVYISCRISVRYELTWPSLNSLCHFLMLELLKHSSPKAFFSNTVVFWVFFQAECKIQWKCAAWFLNSFFCNSDNTLSRAHHFFTSVQEPHYSSYDVRFGIERCRKHSSLREYCSCACIIYPRFPTSVWWCRQLTDKDQP